MALWYISWPFPFLVYYKKKNLATLEDTHRARGSEGVD
jgi:hypothetical protein